MTFNPTPFEFLPALVEWLAAAGAIFAVMLLVGLVVALVMHGARGPAAVGGQVAEGLTDMVRLSFRRIWALTMLTFRESVRRKALMVFAIFAVLFMFAGWFMPETDLRPDLQVKNHVSFVLRTIGWFMLPIALLLACWGLPEDIKARSLHTVVTKPVRKSEIVLGRMLGFTLVGTLILAVMGVVGYVWIVRQVPTEAQANLVSRVPIYGQLSFRDREGRPSERGINTGDIWEHRSFIEGATKARAIWTFENVTPAAMVETYNEDGEPGERLVIESRLEAFRTHKGEDREGDIRPLLVELHVVKDLRERAALALETTRDLQPAGEAVRQGDFAAAANRLRTVADGLEKQQLDLGQGDYDAIAEGADRLIELMQPLRDGSSDYAEWIGETVEAARQSARAARARSAADLSAGMARLGELFGEHADAFEALLVNVAYRHGTFLVQEFSENISYLPRDLDKQKFSINGQEGLRAGDLFDDLVHGGEMQVHVMCVDSGQYLGMAQPDLFVRTPDKPFISGFTKALAGIWLMTALVVVIGVTASTFSKGPVAAMLTFTLLIIGSQPAYGFLEKLTHPDQQERLKGAGTFESMYRLVKHMNPQTEIENETGRTVLTVMDAPLNGLRWLMHRLVPNFDTYSMSERVANGFDVPWAEQYKALLPGLLMMLGYLVPCLVLAYYSLKLRELEAK